MGLPLFHHPLLHRPCFRREVHTYQVKLALVRLEGAGILVVLDLPEGFLGGLVQFQLNDVDVVFRLDGDVHTALAGGLFHLHVESQKLEHQVERVLEVFFGITRYAVITPRQHGLHQQQEIFRPAFIHSHDKAAEETCLVIVAYRRIIGQQEIEEAPFYFLVGKTERIDAHVAVVILDGEVTALVKHGDRVRCLGGRFGEHFGHDFLPFQVSQLVIFGMQQLDL